MTDEEDHADDKAGTCFDSNLICSLLSGNQPFTPLQMDINGDLKNNL
jgi:hypothetical protein